MSNLPAQFACEKTDIPDRNRQTDRCRAGRAEPSIRLSDWMAETRDACWKEQKRKYAAADAGDSGDENEFNGRIVFHGISSFKRVYGSLFFFGVAKQLFDRSVQNFCQLESKGDRRVVVPSFNQTDGLSGNVGKISQLGLAQAVARGTPSDDCAAASRHLLL